jgi:hypothetical protein
VGVYARYRAGARGTVDDAGQVAAFRAQVDHAAAAADAVAGGLP